MKIRKKTSFMLLAASTAAVVGVAAVSFAAWMNEGTTLSAQASTGDIYYVGFGENASLSLGNKDLVPYNQEPGSFDADANTTVISVKLPDFTTYEAYTLTIKAYATYTAATDTAEASGTITTLPLYATYGEQVTDVSAWTNTTEGWVSLANGNALTYDGTETSTDVENPVTGQYISIVLDSNDYAQSGQTFHIEVVLSH